MVNLAVMIFWQHLALQIEKGFTSQFLFNQL